MTSDEPMTALCLLLERSSHQIAVSEQKLRSTELNIAQVEARLKQSFALLEKSVALGCELLLPAAGNGTLGSDILMIIPGAVRSDTGGR